MGAQCSPRCTHMRIGGMVGQFTPLPSGPGLLFCTIDDDNVRLLFFFSTQASYVNPPLLHSNKLRPIALNNGAEPQKNEKLGSKEIQNFIDIWV